jgi:ribonuclease R
MRTLGRAEPRIVALFERLPDGSGRARPADRRNKSEYVVPAREAGDAHAGDVVLLQPHATPRFGPTRARVVERIGHEDDPGVVSLIAAHSHGIPLSFPPAALAAARACRPAPLGERMDLRAVPFVTIDGADARDFDDAVFAEPVPDGGWHAAVAIADVAWYARPGEALDRGARDRGTSVYFPDRVVPMLPEELSNELCSLKPGQDRACLVAHLWFDDTGRMKRHRFERALIRSLARLTYEQVQDAHDGRVDGYTAPLMAEAIKPLYGAYAALARARAARGVLEIDVPERLVEMDASKRIRRIAPRQRLESHKLIEEFMIAANVAAAATLESRHTSCMYRIHDTPDPVKVAALADVMTGIGLKFAKGQVMRPAQFNRLLDHARGTPHWEVVNDMVLRTQAQARYAHENIGHYGLGLTRYCHFTSPIRRYADVLVHRALIRALKLGEGGLSDDEVARFEELGDRISDLERRGVAAERDALDRYVAAYLAPRAGAEFDGRVTGVTRAGLFVTLAETGASGLVPMSFLPRDFYDHDARRQRLVGREDGRVFSLGDRVRARLVEAEAATGSLLFSLSADDDAPPGSLPARHARLPSRLGRPARPGHQGRRFNPPRRGRRSTPR